MPADSTSGSFFVPCETGLSLFIGVQGSEARGGRMIRTGESPNAAVVRVDDDADIVIVCAVSVSRSPGPALVRGLRESFAGGTGTEPAAGEAREAALPLAIRPSTRSRFAARATPMERSNDGGGGPAAKLIAPPTKRPIGEPFALNIRGGGGRGVIRAGESLLLFRVRSHCGVFVGVRVYSSFAIRQAPAGDSLDEMLVGGCRAARGVAAV